MKKLLLALIAIILISSTAFGSTLLPNGNFTDSNIQIKWGFVKILNNYPSSDGNPPPSYFAISPSLNQHNLWGSDGDNNSGNLSGWNGYGGGGDIDSGGMFPINWVAPVSSVISFDLNIYRYLNNYCFGTCTYDLGHNAYLAVKKKSGAYTYNDINSQMLGTSIKVIYFSDYNLKNCPTNSSSTCYTTSNLLSFTTPISSPLNAGDGLAFFIYNYTHGDWYVTYIGMLIDNIRYSETGTILEVTDPSQPIDAYSSFEIKTLVKIVDENTSGTYITNADVNVKINGVKYTMPYSSGYYRATIPGLPQGNYVYDMNALDKNGHGLGTATGTLQVKRSLIPNLQIIDIENMNHSINKYNVDLFPTNESNELIWKAMNNDLNYLMIVDYNLWNSLNNGNQYWVYTSDDNGVTYALNDSLTYGTTDYNPVQKLWQDVNSKYSYSFTDSLAAGQTRYYKLKYQSPVAFWQTLSSSTGWFKQYEPVNSTLLGLNQDLFTTSVFNNLRNYYITYLPQLLQYSDGVFEFQFTAWSDSPQTIKIGTLDNNVDTIVDSIVVNSTRKRYSITIPNSTYSSQLLFLTDANATNNVYFMDYAIIEKNYFTKRLRILQVDGSELPVQIISGTSNNYLQEGYSYQINTAAFDRNGDLNYLQVQVFLDNNSQGVKTYNIPLTSSAGQTHNLIETLDPVIDLNGIWNNPLTPRTLFIYAKLYNSLGSIVSEQSQTVKFLQFPHFPNDLMLQVSLLSAQVGESPTLDIRTTSKALNSLLGYKIIIYKEGTGKTLTNPDYSLILYKDKDFSCSYNCNLRFKLDQFVYPSNGSYRVVVLALLNTENENFSDSYAMSSQHAIVTFKNFTVARILEIIERDQTQNSQYNNTEPIGLAVQLKTGDGANLQSSLRVQLRLSNCDSNTGGTCTENSTLFDPTSIAYDPTTHYNYYFFRNYFVNDDGSLLYDGNIYRFKAIISDAKSQFSGDTNALLTGKCQTYDASNFFSMVLSSLNYMVFGCTVDQEGIVTTATNSGQEKRIIINNAYTTNPPTIEATFCLNADNNNHYIDAFQQDILCASWYKVSDQTIDKFNFWITNKYSDTSKTDSTTQYLKVEVPFEIIALNDMPLLKSTLETKFDTTINTLGDAVYYGFNDLFNGLVNPLGTHASFLASNYATNGMLTNVGFDVNFQRAFDPQYVSGLIFFRVKGLSVVNQHDYQETYPVLQDQSPSVFRSWAKQSGVSVPNGNTIVEIYGSDMEKIASYTTPTGLIINEEPSLLRQVQQTDVNSTVFSQSLPKRMLFNVITDIVAGNGSYLQSRYVPITITAIITEKPLSTLEAISKSASLLFTDPLEWMTRNLFWEVIFLCILLVLAFVLGRTVIPIMVAGKRE
jgi:hypothetical protein